jgi:ferredoxin, 2Fe-2S
MPKLFVTDREGALHELDATLGWSVMEIIRENNLPIEAACGGCCACATCHVYVDEAWLGRLEQANQDENMMLDEAFEVRDNSRLSCQVKFTAALDGLQLTLAPEF